jgi:uncharacterized protein YqgC (DUF456 family)
MTNILLTIVFAVLMLPGLTGILIPVLPGIPFMFIVALIFGLIDKFVHLTTIEIIILLGLTLISLVIDYASGILGARIGGASAKSTLGGLIGMIIGLIIFPPFGGIIGLFLGIAITEIAIHNNNKKALKAATGGVIGSLAGIILNLILALIFLTIFIIFSLA